MTAPSYGEMFRVFGRIGCLSFGGPAAQIALMHKELVDERDWLSEKGFLSALSFTMLLPGPEAMQLATYAGWRLRGWPGGLMAGLLFVLPGAALIFALAALYIAVGSVPLVEALFLGIKATVVVIVLEALLKVSRRALKAPAHWAIAGLSFLAIFAFAAPFPLIIVLAALWGALAARPQEAPDAPSAPVRVPATPAQTLGTVALWAALWAAPFGPLLLTDAAFLTDIGLFFSKLAIVTFGGAYAVLAYMTQEVVANYGWVTTDEMMDALGLAETTPGPLILVTQFVGTLAGAGAGGIGLALVAGLLTLWVTFTPCFLWIFAGAPYIERIAANARLAGALSGITAAVVGVILNLSLWFAAHVVFGEVGRVSLGPVDTIRPVWSSLDPAAIVLSLMAGVLILWLRRPLVQTLGIAAVAGVAVSAVL